MGLIARYSENLVEAGCDEAGRGCLAGPVVAAAVVFPFGTDIQELNDSKQLSEKKRLALREVIFEKASAFGIGIVTAAEIDSINILNASFLAMHRAINQLALVPDLLLIDGNRFNPYKKIKHVCIVGGDAKYQSIAAASILAKTERDGIMKRYHEQFPEYNWLKNKGYPTSEHRDAIARIGLSELHRKSFNTSVQLKMDLK